MRSAAKAGTARINQEGGVFYYYTPSALEAGDVDTSKWAVGNMDKTRRGKSRGRGKGKKRTTGESSAEEGELSDADSLASLNKKVKNAWGAAGASRA